MAYIRKEDSLLEPNRLHSENITCSKRIKIKWENVILTGRVVFLLVFSKLAPELWRMSFWNIHRAEDEKTNLQVCRKDETKTSMSAQ